MLVDGDRKTRGYGPQEALTKMLQSKACLFDKSLCDIYAALKCLDFHYMPLRARASLYEDLEWQASTKLASR
jgi:hypothetical protein